MDNITLGAAQALAKKLGADPDLVTAAVEAWLDAHPEATTTVEDGSITKAKLDQILQGIVDDVPELKSAMELQLGINDSETVLSTVLTKTGSAQTEWFLDIIDADQYTNGLYIVVGEPSGIEGTLQYVAYVRVRYSDSTNNITYIEKPNKSCKITIDQSKTVTYIDFIGYRSGSTPSGSLATSWPILFYIGNKLDKAVVELSSVDNDISDIKDTLYVTTDNLLDFQTDGFWERKNFDGTTQNYTVRTVNKIPLAGGTKVYTALNGLSTETFGTAFNIKIREYNNNNQQVGSDHTMNTIGSQATLSFTMDSTATSIVVQLSSNNYSKQFTVAELMALNPLIYVGTNSKVTYKTIYRHKDFEYKLEFIDVDSDIAELKEKIDPMAFAGLIPAADIGQYPSFDTSAKTFTLYANTVIVDRRGSNGKYITNASAIVYDYSAVAAQSSAIIFTWDVDNGTVKAFKYDATIDYAKFIPLCMFRTGKNVASSSIPIYIDGLLFGKIDETKINQGSVWTNPNVRSINHRGYTETAPENTLPAFKLSKDHGYDGVETDVRFTSDGVAVLLHDASINRTARNADGTELSSTVNIADISYEDALDYDFGVYKSTAYAGTKIPTFKQFIIACRRLGLHPYIELKVGTQAQIEGLVDTVILNGMKGKVTWIGYSPTYLGYVKNYAEGERLGLIADTYQSSLVTAANSLKTEKNEVMLEITTYAQITDAVIAVLAENDIPLETYSNGNYALVGTKAYVTGFTSDLPAPARQYMYQLWTYNNN